MKHTKATIERRPCGFTLLETLIVIGISTVAFAALVNMYLTFNSVYGYQQAFIAAAGSAGTSMNAFSATVLPASAVLASHTFSGIAYSSGSGTLVLELPAIDASGVTIVGVKDYVVFYASGTTLYRLTETAVESSRTPGLKTLSQTLNTLTFTYDNADLTKATSVTVDITTRAAFKHHVVDSHLREQLYLRNLTTLP